MTVYAPLLLAHGCAAAPQPFRYRHQGSSATIGRKSAVADFGWVKLTSALAWWRWGAVHILFLARRRNQFSVILGWVWSYFTFDVGVRLIMGDGPPRASAALAGEQPDSHQPTALPYHPYDRSRLERGIGLGHEPIVRLSMLAFVLITGIL